MLAHLKDKGLFMGDDLKYNGDLGCFSYSNEDEVFHSKLEGI